MVLVRPRYSRIEKLVAEILEKNSVTEPEVPIEKLIRAEGIRIVYEDLNELSGMIIRQGDEATIAVHAEHNRARQKFTLAHEFGHYLLHDGRPVRYDTDFRVNLRSDSSSLANDPEEIEANFFAANILMPSSMMERDLENVAVDVSDSATIRQLKRRYGVSTQAMTLRLGRFLGLRL